VKKVLGMLIVTAALGGLTGCGTQRQASPLKPSRAVAVAPFRSANPVAGQAAWREAGQAAPRGVRGIDIGGSDGDRSSTQIWAVTDQGQILSSLNGGKVWTTAASGHPALSAIVYDGLGHTSNWFPSGCAVGTNGAVVYFGPATQFAKQAWKVADSGTTAELTAVSWGGVGQFWAVGDSGTIIHSTDYGATWSPVSSGIGETLSAVCFGDDKHGWIVGQDGVALATIDGATWRRLAVPTTVALNDVVFVDAEHGWVCGDGGVVLHTKDGGLHWLIQNTPLTGNIRGIDFIDSKRGWVVDGTGATRRRDRLHRSHDRLGRRQFERACDHHRWLARHHWTGDEGPAADECSGGAEDVVQFHYQRRTVRLGSRGD
jgi:photosystem II stability/assembly factor-like uncharacterized protein